MSDEKISANIHFKGTSLKIPKEYVKEKNNFVNISNPTYDPTIFNQRYITEIGLYNSDNDLMILSKLQSPVLRQGLQNFLIKFDF